MIRSLSRRLTTRRESNDASAAATAGGARDPSTSPPRRHRRRSSAVAALDTVDENRNIESEPPEWVKREYQAANVPIPSSLPPSASFSSIQTTTTDMLAPSPEITSPILEVMKIPPPLPSSSPSGTSPTAQGVSPPRLAKSFSIKRTFPSRIRVIPTRSHDRRSSEGTTEMMMGLGDQVKNIDVHNMRKVNPNIEAGVGIISGARTAGSYTWLGGVDGTPAISVPAMPDKWNPPRQGSIGQLRPSRQAPRIPEMIDYNAIRFPSDPLTPLFYALTPDALDGVQLITDRSNLRKLHLFCAPPSAESECSVDFRFDSEIKDNIVHWTRWEPASRRKHQVMGLSYAPSLIDALTIRSQGVDVEGGTMGLVRYRLGVLDVLVRFEVDAVVDTPNKKMEVDEELDGPSLASSPTLKVQPHYRPHPEQDQYLDIKVASSATEIDLMGIYASMVYAQTARICIAEHHKGHFKAPEILELHGSELRQVAMEQEGAVAKVAVLAGKIVEATKKYERVSVVCRDGTVRILKIGQRASKSP